MKGNGWGGGEGQDPIIDSSQAVGQKLPGKA